MPHMPRMGNAGRQLKSFFWRPAVEQEVDAELAFHFEMTIRELMERGMTRDQARAEAASRFGNIDTVAAECEQFGRERDRNASRAEVRTELQQDVTFAVRQLARARSFTAVAVLTLALGVGATAAVFSALYAVVLRPLPFANPDRVVVVQRTLKGEASSVSPAEFVELRDHATGFQHIAAGLLQNGYTLMQGDVPEMVGGGRVTHDFFKVFGVAPILGRQFDATEDLVGAPHVAMISHRFWISHFNGDGRVIGKSMHLDGEAYTVIGVMPASFDLTKDSEDIWTPLAFTPEDIEHTGAHYLASFGRLRDGVTRIQATDQATRLIQGLVARRSDTHGSVTDQGAALVPYIDEFVGRYRGLFYILLGAVSFVLLIACTNVANLVLAHGTARARELAIRAALGAGRGRLIRQLLTESLVLSAGGALLGVGVAYAILRGVRAISPEGIPRLEQASIDWRVLAFTLALALLCSVIFGLVPALRAAGPSLQGTLRESGRTATGGAGRDHLRGVLVAAEVALAMTLLTGAGLLIHSAWLVQHVSPGFDPRGVLAARIVLPGARYADAGAVTHTYARIRDDAEQTPGVAAAALSSVVPLSGSSMHSSVRRDGMLPQDAPSANLRLVSPGYFGTMSIPIRVGRDLTARDDESAPRVIVINEALAHRLWPGIRLADILGKRIDAISEKKDVPEYREVVGVVGDLHDAALSKPMDAEFYLPVPQTPPTLWPLIQRSLVLIVRAANPALDGMALKKPIQQMVAHVDPALPLADAKTMTDYIKGSLATARFDTILLSMLGAIALTLAIVGVYGVVAYFVTQRTQEIGIRMALGATPKQIWQHVVRRGLSPIVIGVAIGLALSAVTAGVLENQLFGVKTTDPWTFTAVAALLGAVSLVATYVPARRAMRVAPIVALNAG
jgi:putative ABC transport system permease protein